MKWFRRAVLALRLARGDVGLWLGEIRNGGEVVGIRIPLDRAPSSHSNHGFWGEKRWRYREDSDTVFHWTYNELTDDEKKAVEQWLAERGVYVRKHAGNTQQIRVGGEPMLGMTFSHGSGPRARWKMRVDVVEV